MAGAARHVRPLLQEALDDAVLERMEGDDDEPAAFGKHRLGRGKRFGELFKLAVYEDAERLERARRRMDARSAGRSGRGRHDLGKALGPDDRRLRPGALDGACDPPGLPLLAVDADDRGKLSRARIVHHRGGVGAAFSHAHVERAGVAEGEAALGAVELHRGDADIEHDAVDRKEAGCARMRVEIGEPPLDQDQPPARLRDQGRTGFDRLGIAIDGKHQAAALDDGAGIAAAAEGAVDVAAAFDDGEMLKHLGQEDRNVVGRSASSLVRAAARRHAGSPLPEAVEFDLPSPRVSERRCSRASRCRPAKRSGSQI